MKFPVKSRTTKYLAALGIGMGAGMGLGLAIHKYVEHKLFVVAGED